MRLRLIALALAACTPALAQPRLSTLALSCQGAEALVARQGAAVLSTSPTAYDRYVRDAGFCRIDETAEPAWVPTADTPQCFIGYRCLGRESHDQRQD